MGILSRILGSSKPNCIYILKAKRRDTGQIEEIERMEEKVNWRDVMDGFDPAEYSAVWLYQVCEDGKGKKTSKTVWFKPLKQPTIYRGNTITLDDIKKFKELLNMLNELQPKTPSFTEILERLIEEHALLRGLMKEYVGEFLGQPQNTTDELDKVINYFIKLAQLRGMIAAPQQQVNVTSTAPQAPLPQVPSNPTTPKELPKNVMERINNVVEEEFKRMEKTLNEEMERVAKILEEEAPCKRWAKIDGKEVCVE